VRPARVVALVREPVLVPARAPVREQAPELGPDSATAWSECYHCRTPRRMPG